MENIADQINSLIEFPIDFAGQKKVDKYVKYSVYLAIPISVFAGLVTDNIVSALIAFAACILVTFVIVLPSWPAYNKNPSTWLQVKYDL